MDGPSRPYRPGGSYFLTLALAQAGGSLLTDRIDDLRAAYAAVWLAQSFSCTAMVVLPDHIHAIWTVPPHDTALLARIRALQTRFAQVVGQRDIWADTPPPHAIRDRDDLTAYRHGIWADPVRHGLVPRPALWPHSSLHRDLAQGRAAAHWRDSAPRPLPDFPQGIGDAAMRCIPRLVSGRQTAAPH